MLGTRLIQILVTIVLARLLVPEDFGIIGLLILFTELGKVLLESGFSQALIRENSNSPLRYSSIFYFNILTGVFIYSFFFILAPSISEFYQFSDLAPIARVVFLSIFVNSLGIVPSAIIIKEIDFKTLAKRTIYASSISGIISIILAFLNFGVWALVTQIVLSSILRLILIWYYSNWRPSLQFSFYEVKTLFSFSYKLLITGVVDVIASNIQTLLIGKYYTKLDLGFYTQSKQLSNIPSQTLTAAIRNVTYPAFSKMQHSNSDFKNAFRKTLVLNSLLVTPIMFWLIASSKYIIIFLIGDKWLPSVNYFIIFCLAGSIYPLYSINQNIFLSKGRSDLYMKINLLNKLILLGFVFISLRYGVYYLVLSYTASAFLGAFINMVYSGRLINYSFSNQLKDLSEIFIFSFSILVSISILDSLVQFSSSIYALTLFGLIGLLNLLFYYFFGKFKSFIYLREIINR